MASVVCKFCIMYHGLSGGALPTWPTADDPDTDEWLFKHIETEHHLPVRRANESHAEAIQRFKIENPDAGGPNCKCPDCARRRIANGQ